MRRVIRANSPERETATREKLRKSRLAKSKTTTIEKMKASEDPDIRFLADLDGGDKFRITEGDTDNYAYRWVREDLIRDRQSKGYVVDDGDTKTLFDGNFIHADGSDKRRQNYGGLRLMKIRKDLFEKRVAAKQDKIRENSDALERSMKSSMDSNLPRGASVLSDNDSFMKDVAEGG